MSSRRTTAGLLLVAAAALPLTAAPPADLALELVTGGLDQPVAVRHAGDGSGRLFIVERGGLIRIWDGTALLAAPFLDLVGEVDATNGEQGLLGLAFHPDYATNGLFYVSYTRDPGPGLDRSVIARYTVSADPDVAAAGSGVTVLELEQPAGNHNGGDIHFGLDGYLYYAMGDGGSGGAPAQDLGSLLGKVMRLDVDAAPPPAPNDLCGLVTGYGIPPGNPYAGGSGDCDEIWQSGLRHPWRFSVDRANGDLVLGDVGQGSVEEIDHAPAAAGGGENWGWRCYEGSSEFNLGGCGPMASYDFPIFEYLQDTPENHCAVIGGFRYRGSVIGGLGGLYAYADFCSGHLWLGENSGGGWSSELWSDLPLSPSGFGEDEEGELYLAAYGGAIYRFTSPSSIFTDGFESGDLAAWSAGVP